MGLIPLIFSETGSHQRTTLTLTGANSTGHSQLCHRMGRPGVKAGAREAARIDVRDPQDSARWSETPRTCLCKPHKCFNAEVIQNRDAE